MTKQRDLWENMAFGIDPIWEKVIDLKEKQGNLRRGVFHRYDKMKKEIEELRKEIFRLQNFLGMPKEKFFENIEN